MDAVTLPSWRNRLARSAVNRKVGGSNPPGGGVFYLQNFLQNNLIKNHYFSFIFAYPYSLKPPP